MQFFWFFHTNTEGTSYGRKRTGGAYPKGTLRRGLVHANTKKLINFIVLFPAAKRTKKCEGFSFIFLEYIK